AEQDLYELLGVPPDASDREVKRAYHRRAGLLHPDKCAGDACATADEKMAVLNDAYEILSSPE
ncbi:DnaJ domain-containing protein, partial [Pavlovales sp. CCMP2436]